MYLYVYVYVLTRGFAIQENLLQFAINICYILQNIILKSLQFRKLK